MRTQLNFCCPYVSADFRILLFITLLTLGFPTVSLAGCADYQADVSQAVQTEDFNTLEKLLSTLNKQADCPVSYLDGAKRSMTQIAAAKADVLVAQNQLAEAEAWLKRAPVTLWVTQVIYGDIAMRREQWQDASRFYRQALDLISESQTMPSLKEVIKKIKKLASEAQAKADKLDTTKERDVSRGVSR
jgi:rubrerythrin